MKKALLFLSVIICNIGYSQDYSIIQNGSLNIDITSHVIHNQQLQMSHTTPNSSGKAANCLGYNGSSANDVNCDMDTSTLGTYSFTVNSTDELGVSGTKSISYNVYDPALVKAVPNATSVNSSFSTVISISSDQAITPSYNSTYGGMEFVDGGYRKINITGEGAISRVTRMVLEVRAQSGVTTGANFTAEGCTGAWNFMISPNFTIDTSWRSYDIALTNGNANPASSTSCALYLQFGGGSVGSNIYIRNWVLY